MKKNIISLVMGHIGIAFLIPTWIVADDGAFLSSWNASEIQPIECNAMFIDQDGKPLVHKKIDAAIINLKPGGIISDRKAIPLETDQDGSIHVSGERGGRLWMRVSDPAYANGSENQFDEGGVTFVYSKVSGDATKDHGDSEHPVIVRVWRKLGPQPLIVIKSDLEIAYSTFPIMIDLVKGQLVDEGGDMIIAVNQPSTDAEISAASANIGPDALRLGIFTWSCSVSIIGGGLIEEPDNSIFPLRVFGIPNIPMIPSRNFNLSGKEHGVRVNLLIRARSGMVNGKVHLDIDSGRRSYNGNILLRMSGTVNATGSSSLEMDPGQLTSVKIIDVRKSSKSGIRKE